MKEKGGKVQSVLDVAENIAEALHGISSQVKRFNDIWEGISFDMKRYTDLQEGKFKDAARVESKEALREEHEKPAPERPKRRARSENNNPDTLYKSIISISQQKQELTTTEVINCAMKYARGSFKKQSVRTTLQGFKVGSKTANRQPEKCRDLIILVEGEKGLYRLNPEKMRSSA